MAKKTGEYKWKLVNGERINYKKQGAAKKIK